MEGIYNDSIVSQSERKPPNLDYIIQGGLNIDIPGIQHPLYVGQVVAKDSMLLINSRFGKHLKFILKTLFQTYHRIVINQR